MKKRLLLSLLIFTLCLALALPALAADDYPAKYRNAPKDSLTDEWRFYNRECVSFVAWCLSSRNGIAFSNYMGGRWWGNANTWDDTARALGYRVDKTPAVGAVAYWDQGYYGHVAWVSAVNGNNVTIEEYNYDPDGTYHTRTISAAEPHGYIHIKDLTAAPAPAAPSVAFSPWEDENYTYVGENDAVLGQKIAVSGGKCSRIGLYLMDEDGAYLGEAHSIYTTAQVCFYINRDCGLTLAPGTVYRYKFYAVVDDKTYWGREGSFHTAGEDLQVEEDPGEVRAVLPALAEEVHFPTADRYVTGQFSDVREDDWFAEAVRRGYELGLIKGAGASSFNPAGQLTVAEAVTLACRLHSIYHTGRNSIPTAPGPWYQPYLDYAYKNGIIGADLFFTDAAKAATRAQFAEIFAHALPESALYPINEIADGAVPDVAENAPHAESIYRLYRAGVLTGMDAAGSFAPGSSIRRCEAAAILSRMAESDYRLEIEL